MFQPTPSQSSQTFYSENISLLTNPFSLSLSLLPPSFPPLMTNWKRSNRKRTLTPLATPPSTIPPLLSPPPPTMAGLHWSFFERRHTRHRDTYAVLLGRPHHPAGKFLKIESSTGGQRLTCAYTNSLWMMQTCRHTRAYIHSYIHTYRERLSERKEGWSRD